jgi:hypothetical protein
MTFSSDSNPVHAFTAGAKETHLLIIETMQLLSHYCLPHPWCVFYRQFLPMSKHPAGAVWTSAVEHESAR